ncbi:MAG: adenine phosphoribosyltransferase [Elusimicrobiota bacterium]|jgi:adenine phosphoribosyltransferase|nr:adenine phosphoribosyltransferase [Elusimicrobiota bacterium]
MKISARAAGLIRDVPDFPQKGIVFKDITPLLADGAVFKEVIAAFAALCRGRGITKVAGIEARGFLFASALAYELGVGLVPIRKPGKLPCDAVCETFTLEYGTGKIEMHKDALTPADNVVLVDDVLATGGTMKAAIYLTRKLGARLEGCLFLMELGFLNGREHLDADVKALIKF